MPSDQPADHIDLDAPIVMVSADTHIGPRLKEDLRAYCPQKYLEEYDSFVKAYEPFMKPSVVRKMFVPEDMDLGEMAGADDTFTPSNNTAGHYDIHTRLKDMDRDGVAGEVVYHGSQNAQCFPLLNTAGGTFNALVFSPIGSPHELELAAVGQHMYNHWLADQCSVAPERFAGLAHVPMWDIEAAIKEVEWASDAGLKGVNFPAPKLGIAPYDEPEWERFWAVCAERNMALSTHAGSDIDSVTNARPHTLLVMDMYDPQEKILPRMMFGGVFERHPNLKFVITELQKPPSRWWSQAVDYYDELWEANIDALRKQVPKPPREYFRNNVFHGNSLLFLDPQQVEIAVERGYASNILWGSDYPHAEGPYRLPANDTEETRTVKALRNGVAGAPAEVVKQIAGETAVKVYGMDGDKLAAVARRINAITLRWAMTPLDVVPPDWKELARMTLPFPEYHRAMAAV